MPLMTKIRDNLTKAFAIFAGIFVVYIVLDWGMDITGQMQASRARMSEEIGSINGEAILFTKFSELVHNTAQNQKNQTGVEPNEEQLRTIRDQIWNQLVEQQLYEEQSKRLGIKVTNQEIVDWVRGDTPPEFLRQQFTDSLGNFNRQAYESAIQNPQNRAIWIQIEDILKRQRQQDKLRSIVMASARVSEEEVKQKFIDQNIKYEAEYILFDPNILVKDDEIQISEDDLRRFYNEHSQEYKVDASRKLKYVSFKEIPSKSDTEAVVNEINELLKRATLGANFEELAQTYSETPSSDAFFKHGELTPEKETALFAAKVGDIVGPIKEGDGYHLMKVLEFRDGKDEFVRASHILIKIEGTDSAAALQKAKDILIRLKKGENFSDLALQYSQDPGSATKGGDLGWFGKNRMVKEFETAAFKTKVGQVTGPVRSPFGYHIIKVTGRDSREVKFTNIHLNIRTSSQTKELLYSQAEDFAAQAKDKGFEVVAEELNYTVTETPAFQKGGIVPGIGMNTSINRFAFSNKRGSISDVFTTTDAYIVCMISEVREAGIRPFEELKSALEARVKRQKKMDKIKTLAAEVLQKLSPNESLEKVTDYYANLSAQRVAPTTLGVPIPGIGRDLGFVGSLSGLRVGEISQPIEGSRGYYIVKLLSMSPFDTTMYNIQKEGIRNQLLSERQNRIFAEWFENLKKNADIIDNRDLFYR